jgi:hypothetical protein
MSSGGPDVVHEWVYFSPLNNQVHQWARITERTFCVGRDLETGEPVMWLYSSPRD